MTGISRWTQVKIGVASEYFAGCDSGDVLYHEIGHRKHLKLVTCDDAVGCETQHFNTTCTRSTLPVHAVCETL